eukprot:127092-Alexandrium_andersonii.AAC.1
MWFCSPRAQGAANRPRRRDPRPQPRPKPHFGDIRNARTKQPATREGATNGPNAEGPSGTGNDA